MAPHQSNSINGNKGVKTLAMSHTLDILSGNDIENAVNVYSDVGSVTTSHQNGSFVKELGIEFTYKEK